MSKKKTHFLRLNLSEKMSIRLDWTCLTPSYATTVKNALNVKLQELLQSAGEGGAAARHVRGLEIIDLCWGDVPPFVEITDIGDYVNMCVADGTSRPDTPSSLDGAYGGDHPTLSSGVVTPVTEGPPEATPGANSDASQKLLQLFGEDGLFLKVHCTYGGNLRLQIKCELCYDIEFAPSCVLGVSLPLVCDISEIKFDGHVVANVSPTMTNQVFIASGSSPLTNVNITAHFGSTKDQVYVDEDKVCSFVVVQLRKLLTQSIVEPNYVTF